MKGLRIIRRPRIGTEWLIVVEVSPSTAAPWLAFFPSPNGKMQRRRLSSVRPMWEELSDRALLPLYGQAENAVKPKCGDVLRTVEERIAPANWQTAAAYMASHDDLMRLRAEHDMILRELGKVRADMADTTEKIGRSSRPFPAASRQLPNNDRADSDAGQRAGIPIALRAAPVSTVPNA